MITKRNRTTTLLTALLCMLGATAPALATPLDRPADPVYYNVFDPDGVAVYRCATGIRH